MYYDPVKSDWTVRNVHKTQFVAPSERLFAVVEGEGLQLGSTFQVGDSEASFPLSDPFVEDPLITAEAIEAARDLEVKQPAGSSFLVVPNVYYKP